MGCSVSKEDVAWQQGDGAPRDPSQVDARVREGVPAADGRPSRMSAPLAGPDPLEGATIVEQVEGPAAAAGVEVGMELLSVNDVDVTGAAYGLSLLEHALAEGDAALGLQTRPKVIETTLHKEMQTSKLGLTLKSMDHTTEISELAEGGIAAANPQLRVGLLLLSVNGKAVSSHFQGSDFLRAAVGDITLEVQARPEVLSATIPKQGDSVAHGLTLDSPDTRPIPFVTLPEPKVCARMRARARASDRCGAPVMELVARSASREVCDTVWRSNLARR